ncbi:hypothetical protein GALL_194800 [mine drainage metagenome]|uniref:Uncharacterized protein n=1 Tax=mine drainage metagenome TaxID=410659 RepID=A0A1J5RS35_9ZZZZ
MNLPMRFRYIQANQSCVTRDMRKKHEMEIALEHSYFVGFRITAESVMSYQHTLILTDDYESLVIGICEERNMILDQQLATSLNDIEPVFVRSLLMQDQVMIAFIDAYGINTEIREILSRRDDHRFTVLGMLGNEEICLIPENAHDALAAMRLARWESIKLAAKVFQPLDVRQAHPVTREFEIRFHRVVDQFMELLESSCEKGQLQ